MQRIALATSRKFVSLTDDDRLLIEPLRSRGFAAEPAVWSDPDVPWSGCDAVILRSCWDYHLRLAEFLAWVGWLEKAGVPLWNPPEMVRWNANKSYLRDLESRGIPVVPTFWPEQRVSLPEQLRLLGWDRAVIKPRVSATAHRTMLVSADDAADAQSLADELLAGPGSDGAAVHGWNPDQRRVVAGLFLRRVQSCGNQDSEGRRLPRAA